MSVSKVPDSIHRLIAARYPFFFTTSPTREQIAERLVYVLHSFDGVRGSFEATWTKLEDSISARLSWTEPPRLNFIATGADLPEAMFNVTLKAMEHPEFASMFAKAMPESAAQPINVKPTKG